MGTIKKQPTTKPTNKKKGNKLDSLIYWVVQLAFAVLACAGVYNYLQPVEPILSLPITGLLISLMFYVSIKNR